MAKKHVVVVKEAFQHTLQMGALMAGDKEIAPATEKVCTYTVGQRLNFDTKSHAQGFVKFHGDKVEYVGKE